MSVGTSSVTTGKRLEWDWGNFNTGLKYYFPLTGYAKGSLGLGRRFS